MSEDAVVASPPVTDGPVEAFIEKTCARADTKLMFIRADEYGPSKYRCEIQWWRDGVHHLAEAEGEDLRAVITEAQLDYEKRRG